jgi:ribosomal protein S18 acetylase RimI-like enzyme
MVAAEYSNKDQIVDILSRSFNDNKSINYIIRQGTRRLESIKGLMAYSFEMCKAFGQVFLTEDKKGCALILLPEQKKVNLRSILWDVKLISCCIGVSNLKRVIQREGKIKSLQPVGKLCYLWFIGVQPEEQNKGIGGALLTEVIHHAEQQNRTLCLETSTEKNLPWYQKFGFKIYNELDLGYRLYFLKK